VIIVCEDEKRDESEGWVRKVHGVADLPRYHPSIHLEGEEKHGKPP